MSIVEVPLGEINQKVLLEAVSRSGSFDLALPATFGVPDLAESGILVNLDKYAEVHEPADFQKDVLYTIGDYYKGSLYGYETDGDTYLMFYNKPWLDNADEQKAFADKLGYPLKVPDTWEELDAQMAFFHRPEKNMFGGTLFRTQYFIAWEWWGRFHAKGFYPLADDLTPQINNEAGIAALEELIAASKHQYAGAKSNGLFENFEAYGQGTAFANIGWGGTQKYLNSDKSKLKGKLAFGLMPGGKVGGELLRAPTSIGAGTTSSRACPASPRSAISLACMQRARRCRRSPCVTSTATSTRSAAFITRIRKSERFTRQNFWRCIRCRCRTLFRTST